MDRRTIGAIWQGSTTKSQWNCGEEEDAARVGESRRGTVEASGALCKGQVAQLEERWSEKPEVGSSILPLTTERPLSRNGFGVLSSRFSQPTD